MTRVDKATDDEPRPADPAVRNRGATVSAASTGADAHVEDQLVLLHLFNVPELKVACRLRVLPASGVKSDLLRRLVELPGGPSPAQAKQVLQMRQVLKQRGLDYALSVNDTVNRENAREWLSSAQTRLAQRS